MKAHQYTSGGIKVKVIYQGQDQILRPHFFKTAIFSSPEHIVLRVSYCDRSMSGVCPSVRPSVRVSGRPSVNNYLKNLLL